MAKLLITSLTGPSDPTRASIPFHAAVNGAAKITAGSDITIALAGDSTELMKPGVAETVRGVGVPPLADLLAGAKAAGIQLYIWKGCAEARGVSEQHFADRGGKFMTPPDYARMVMEAEKNLSF